VSLPESQTSKVGGGPKRRVPRPQARVHIVSQSLAQANFRLPAKLLRSLTYAATQQKIERLYPTSQQEIVAAALAEWLQRNGYEVEEE